MEFPDLGKSCSWHLCKTLDFLPFTCVSCNQIFCKEHFHQYSHNCTSLNQEKNSPVPTKSFICFNQDCNNVSSVEMLCPKCSKHFCLLHRYHNCFDTVLDIEEKKRLWNEPKAQFAKSIKVVEEAIDQNIKKAIQNPKKQATAMKIQLMKLKGKAVGTPSIPTSNRMYFLLLLPKTLKRESKAIFVSKDWTVGKVIDSVCTICNVVNRNNETSAPKLRLFKTDGTQVSSDTSLKIEELLGSNKILNGETLILEYVNSNEDVVNYILSDFSQYSA